MSRLPRSTADEWAVTERQTDFFNLQVGVTTIYATEATSSGDCGCGLACLLGLACMLQETE